MQLFDGAFSQMEGAAGIDSIGVAAGKGTSTTASATNNTKGSYAPLIAATTRDYIGFIMTIDSLNSTASQTSTEKVCLFDIAIGASGQEKDILPNYPISWPTAPAFAGGAAADGSPTSFIPIAIPMGSRVAARVQNNQTSAEAYGVGLFGVYH
jgi:hypothetical protein